MRQAISLAANSPAMANLCANVQSSFDRLAIFAEQHDLSYSVAAFYVLVGSLNISAANDGKIHLKPASPAHISKVAHMEPKTVSRWCGQLAERGLLQRKRGAYSIERLADWYFLAGCMQTVPLPPLPGLASHPTIGAADVCSEAIAFTGEAGTGSP